MEFTGGNPGWNRRETWSYEDMDVYRPNYEYSSNVWRGWKNSRGGHQRTNYRGNRGRCRGKYRASSMTTYRRSDINQYGHELCYSRKYTNCSYEEQKLRRSAEEEVYANDNLCVDDKAMDPEEVVVLSDSEVLSSDGETIQLEQSGSEMQLERKLCTGTAKEIVREVGASKESRSSYLLISYMNAVEKAHRKIFEKQAAVERTEKESEFAQLSQKKIGSESGVSEENVDDLNRSVGDNTIDFITRRRKSTMITSAAKQGTDTGAQKLIEHKLDENSRPPEGTPTIKRSRKSTASDLSVGRDAVKCNPAVKVKLSQESKNFDGREITKKVSDHDRTQRRAVVKAKSPEESNKSSDGGKIPKKASDQDQTQCNPIVKPKPSEESYKDADKRKISKKTSQESKYSDGRKTPKACDQNQTQQSTSEDKKEGDGTSKRQRRKSLHCYCELEGATHIGNERKKSLKCPKKTKSTRNSNRREEKPKKSHPSTNKGTDAKGDRSESEDASKKNVVSCPAEERSLKVAIPLAKIGRDYVRLDKAEDKENDDGFVSQYYGAKPLKMVVSRRGADREYAATDDMGRGSLKTMVHMRDADKKKCFGELERGRRVEEKKIASTASNNLISQHVGRGGKKDRGKSEKTSGGRRVVGVHKKGVDKENCAKPPSRWGVPSNDGEKLTSKVPVHGILEEYCKTPKNNQKMSTNDIKILDCTLGSLKMYRAESSSLGRGTSTQSTTKEDMEVTKIFEKGTRAAKRSTRSKSMTVVPKKPSASESRASRRPKSVPKPDVDLDDYLVLTDFRVTRSKSCELFKLWPGLDVNTRDDGFKALFPNARKTPKRRNANVANCGYSQSPAVEGGVCETLPLMDAPEVIYGELIPQDPRRNYKQMVMLKDVLPGAEGCGAGARRKSTTDGGFHSSARIRKRRKTNDDPDYRPYKRVNVVPWTESLSSVGRYLHMASCGDGSATSAVDMEVVCRQAKEESLNIAVECTVQLHYRTPRKARAAVVRSSPQLFLASCAQPVVEESVVVVSLEDHIAVLFEHLCMYSIISNDLENIGGIPMSGKRTKLYRDEWRSFGEKHLDKLKNAFRETCKSIANSNVAALFERLDARIHWENIGCSMDDVIAALRAISEGSESNHFCRRIVEYLDERDLKIGAIEIEDTCVNDVNGAFPAPVATSDLGQSMQTSADISLITSPSVTGTPQNASTEVIAESDEWIDIGFLTSADNGTSKTLNDRSNRPSVIIEASPSFNLIKTQLADLHHKVDHISFIQDTISVPNSQIERNPRKSRPNPIILNRVEAPRRHDEDQGATTVNVSLRKLTEIASLKSQVANSEIQNTKPDPPRPHPLPDVRSNNKDDSSKNLPYPKSDPLYSGTTHLHSQIRSNLQHDNIAQQNTYYLQHRNDDRTTIEGIPSVNVSLRNLSEIALLTSQIPNSGIKNVKPDPPHRDVSSNDKEDLLRNLTHPKSGPLHSGMMHSRGQIRANLQHDNIAQPNTYYLQQEKDDGVRIQGVSVVKVPLGRPVEIAPSTSRSTNSGMVSINNAKDHIQNAEPGPMHSGHTGVGHNNKENPWKNFACPRSDFNQLLANLQHHNIAQPNTYYQHAPHYNLHQNLYHKNCNSLNLHRQMLQILQHQNLMQHQNVPLNTVNTSLHTAPLYHPSPETNAPLISFPNDIFSPNKGGTSVSLPKTVFNLGNVDIHAPPTNILNRPLPKNPTSRTSSADSGWDSPLGNLDVNENVRCCFFCNNVALFECPCKQQWYCSQFCQYQDWPRHGIVHT